MMPFTFHYKPDSSISEFHLKLQSILQSKRRDQQHRIWPLKEVGPLLQGLVNICDTSPKDRVTRGMAFNFSHWNSEKLICEVTPGLAYGEDSCDTAQVHRSLSFGCPKYSPPAPECGYRPEGSTKSSTQERVQALA